MFVLITLKNAGFVYFSDRNTITDFYASEIFLVCTSYRQMERSTEIAFSAPQNAENEHQQN